MFCARLKRPQQHLGTDASIKAYNIPIMFCPNCAAQNEVSQHYCRMCGLRLDAIATELAAQHPSLEMAKLLNRRRRMQMLGTFSLATAGIIGLCLALAVAFYYKLAILGPELLFGSAIGALILFVLASVFFFNYPKLFMKTDANDHLPEHIDLSTPTNKLLNDPPFEPASVTEHSTERLRRK